METLANANDEDGVAWLLFDKQGASANTLDDETLRAQRRIEKLERDRPVAW